MSGIQSFKEFVARNRHRMTPQQALDADKRVLDANVHTPSRPATDDEIVGNKYLNDPDWYAKNEGNDPTKKPLYPTSETQAPATTAPEAQIPTPTSAGGEMKG